MVKTVFDAKTGELLGAHMVGAEVTELIQGYTIAKTLETTESELMRTIFPHPTLSEMMHESVLDAYGRASTSRLSSASLRAKRSNLDGSCAPGTRLLRRLRAPRNDRSIRPAPPRKGGAARQSEPAQAAVDPGQGAGLARIPRDPPADARAQPAHRVRRGGLPQYRRVLEGEARDGDDPRRGLHPRLHLLQCRDRAARSARPA